MSESTNKNLVGQPILYIIDALQEVGKFVKVTAAKVHDSKFLNDRNS